jgi:hypothetical protein
MTNPKITHNTNNKDKIMIKKWTRRPPRLLPKSRPAPDQGQNNDQEQTHNQDQTPLSRPFRTPDS